MADGADLLVIRKLMFNDGDLQISEVLITFALLFALSRSIFRNFFKRRFECSLLGCFLQGFFTKSCKLKMENLASGISLTLQPGFPYLFRYENRELQAIFWL